MDNKIQNEITKPLITNKDQKQNQDLKWVKMMLLTQNNLQTATN